jgi:NDP-sugar pyrophosphorylase family protein
MQAVILAGGLGTRLRPLTESVPKPMVLVQGKPFLEYEIELLKKASINDFVFCVGYKATSIEDHFGNGKRFGVNISYSLDGEKPLGPAGALKNAEALLEDMFLVTYGDGYLMMDYAQARDFFVKSKKIGMMVVYENHNKYGRSDLAIKDGYVVKYDKRNQTADMVWINFGVSYLKKESLDFIPAGKFFGEEEFYNQLISREQLSAYETKGRFYDIGTPEALEEFTRFISREKTQ